MASTGVPVGTTCGSLLRELERIWDEVGESEVERDKKLLELEQECLEVYKRKVDQASDARARLQQALSDYEAELSSLVSALGDGSLPDGLKQNMGTLKEQVAAVQPQLADLRHRKEERIRQFVEVQAHIRRILTEISGSSQLIGSEPFTSDIEQDLSLKRLDDYHAQLGELQKEKSERLNQVLDYVKMVQELCAVLGVDFFKTVMEVHPSLDESAAIQSKSITNNTLEKLAKTVLSLQQEKKQRIQKLQDLGASLNDLWNLMDTPVNEQDLFENITSIMGMPEEEIIAPGVLALDNIEQAEVEVERLDQLKVSKMKELVMKKQQELGEIYRKAHMDPDSNTAQEKIMAIIDSGMFDPSELLASMDQHIAKAKEEALSRKEIMEKMERWLAACEEESWLEDYNKDENRYNSSRGAHINLKRAERARATVIKIPALVDTLMAKTKAWEDERGVSFIYDGMPLLEMLEEYNLLRQEKDEGSKRQKGQKKLQEQLTTEQESLFGSRTSPNKLPSAKKGLSPRINGNGAAVGTPGNRRVSLGGAMLQTGSSEMLIPKTNGTTSVRLGKEGKKEGPRPVVPLNYVALPKQEASPPPCMNDLEPATLMAT